MLLVQNDLRSCTNEFVLRKSAPTTTNRILAIKRRVSVVGIVEWIVGWVVEGCFDIAKSEQLDCRCCLPRVATHWRH